MSHVAFFKTFPDRDWPVDTLKRFVVSKGHAFVELSVPQEWRQVDRTVNDIRKAKLLVVWHGDDPGCEWAVKIAQQVGVPHVFVEWGHFPRRETMRFDRSGFGCSSWLSNPKAWPIVSVDQIREAQRYAAEYLDKQNVKWTPGGKTHVVALQTDSAAAVHTGQDMTGLVRTVQSWVAGAGPIVYVPHPQDRGKVLDLPNVIRREPPLLSAISDAVCVHALTSNAVLETALIRFARGDGPNAYMHLKSPLDGEPIAALTELITQQIHRRTTDLSPYLAHAGIAL